MFLNLIITIIIGFIIFILWILKGIFDCISTMDQLIKKLAKVSDLLHDRLSRLEIVDQEKEKKNTTNNEWVNIEYNSIFFCGFDKKGNAGWLKTL